MIFNTVYCAFQSQPLCQWLAGLCLLEARKYEDALLILSKDDTNQTVSVAMTSFSIPPIGEYCILEGFTPRGLQSALLLLKGQVYEKLENRAHAAEYFRIALKNDVYCYQAFHLLEQHHMLTSVEEKELLSSLPFKEQCYENDLLPAVYEILLNKYQSIPQMSLTPALSHPRLSESLDVEVARAEKLYHACAFRQCLSKTQDILKRDPYHPNCLPIHIACLMELKKINQLFYLAHKLVELMPEKAVSWFAVGCYYVIIGKQDTARRYLAKANSLDQLFGPVWLVYGHSLSKEKEHDQAMAAYLCASKLMKGCHLPLLCIGIECGQTNDIRLAERFLNQAKLLAPCDPFLLLELGVVAFQEKDYLMAETHFQTALSCVHQYNQHIIPEKWEPLLNNLGHTCRKLGKFEDALRYHQEALMLSPQNPSTISCIGFVLALQNKTEEAVEMFHKALSLQRDHIFSKHMLQRTLEHLINSSPPFEEDDTFPSTLHTEVILTKSKPNSEPPFKIYEDPNHSSSNKTDGSKTKSGTGAGIVRVRPCRELVVPMGLYLTVFQAEVAAIMECAREKLRLRCRSKTINIFTDSQAALMALDSCVFKSTCCPLIFCLGLLSSRFFPCQNQQYDCLLGSWS
ncbi:anaphase promoting complex subunit cdc16 [Homalodisca vitripennis]|nr:anaphase promoting complex subunit cdc16 [Homalodisca vitripennis]